MFKLRRKNKKKGQLGLTKEEMRDAVYDGIRLASDAQSELEKEKEEKRKKLEYFNSLSPRMRKRLIRFWKEKEAQDGKK
jgi:hypothetical protein